MRTAHSNDVWPAASRPSVLSRSLIASAAICLSLILAVALIYGQTLWHDFVNYDDSLFITENPFIREGLTADSVRWAFRAGLFEPTRRIDFYIPLTALSHALAIEISGLKPWAHHLFNLALHAANAALLFLVLQRMTGRRWPSAFVAAVFAVHPLHVESVAWVTERKNTLSGLFWMLALGAYAWYAERPTSLGRYPGVMACLALGLLSKPMLVTLPLVLLLLDYWPLARWRGLAPAEGRPQFGAWRLALEKVPLLALSAAASWSTLAVQHQVGAVGDLKWLPVWARAANAAVAYVEYIAKLFYPRCLVVLYAHPGTAIALWKALAAAALLAGVTALAVAWLRRRPWFAVGWAWFLGTLVPVIGLVQSGGQAMADRYAYLTQIGLYIIIAWGARESLARWRWRRTALPVLALAIVAVLGVCAWGQTRHWRNTLTLFEHMLACAPNSGLAQLNLGSHYESAGDLERALGYYEAGLRVAPDDPLLHSNVGHMLYLRGRRDEAVEYYRRALAADARCAPALHNYGVALSDRGQTEEALAYYRKAVAADPESAPVRIDLAAAYLKQGQPERALEEYREALRLKPGYALAYFNIGATLEQLGRADEAIASYREALRADPRHALARNNLGAALYKQGRRDEAREQFLLALECAQAAGDVALEQRVRQRLALVAPASDAAVSDTPTTTPLEAAPGAGARK